MSHSLHSPLTFSVVHVLYWRGEFVNQPLNIASWPDLDHDFLAKKYHKDSTVLWSQHITSRHTALTSPAAEAVNPGHLVMLVLAKCLMFPTPHTHQNVIVFSFLTDKNFVCRYLRLCQSPFPHQTWSYQCVFPKSVTTMYLSSDDIFVSIISSVLTLVLHCNGELSLFLPSCVDSMIYIYSLHCSLLVLLMFNTVNLPKGALHIVYLLPVLILL